MTFRYRIYGRITSDDDGRPLEGLLVRAFDRDVAFDDDLGSARSDANGEFAIQFTELDFRDVVETRPDIYLRVFDGQAELISTRGKTRWNAHADERFEIRIPRAKT